MPDRRNGRTFATGTTCLSMDPCVVEQAPVLSSSPMFRSSQTLIVVHPIHFAVVANDFAKHPGP